eukprot:1465423-Prorocentrum_lima.AAC.1
MALHDINSSVKALLEEAAPGPAHRCTEALPDPMHRPQPEPLVPLVWVTIHGVGKCCALALPA